MLTFFGAGVEIKKIVALIFGIDYEAQHRSEPSESGRSGLAQLFRVSDRQDESHRFLERIRDRRSRSEILETAWHSLLGRVLENDRITSRLVAEQAETRLEIDAAQADIARVTAASDELQARLVDILRSRSWRLTAPLRKLATLARHVGADPLSSRATVERDGS